MKKFLLSLAVMAMAVAVQAGDAKASKDSCCAAKTTAQGKTCTATETAAKGGSCSGCCKDGKQTLLSPKAAAEKRA